MKKFAILFLLVLGCALNSTAQTLINVTATITDPDGVVWKNGTWQTELVPPFGSAQVLNNLGHKPLGIQSGVMDNNGTFNVTLDDNTVMTPSGSTLKFTICPNATVVNCFTSIQVIHGNGVSQDLSASISADSISVQVVAFNGLARAYQDTELTLPKQGNLYWRVADNHLRGFNGSTWVDIVGSGGGGGFSGLYSDLLSPTANLALTMNNFTTNYTFGASTGTLGAMIDVTDGINNSGTNYLFRVSTNTNSNAKAFEVCDNGTVNCVEFNGSAILQALGGAQIVATQLVGTGVGIGSMTLGSNGSGSASGANTVKLTGDNNTLKVSENNSPLYQVLNENNGMKVVGRTVLVGPVVAIGSGTCNDTSVALTGLLTTDQVLATPQANPSAAVYNALTVETYAATNNAHVLVCNPSAGSVTPLSLTFNIAAIR